jgi:hypothetical protein
MSHPTLRHVDVPESVEIVMVNGDPNAIYDATGFGSDAFPSGRIACSLL